MTRNETELLEEYLRQAECFVAQGERLIARQCQLIEELDCDGHDTTLAEQILATLEATQDLHVAHRRRLRTSLRSARAMANDHRRVAPAT